MTKPTLTIHSTVIAKEAQSSADLGEETAILDLDTGTYFSVDRVGSRIWDLLKEETTVARICEELLARYDVARETCERDVLAFVGRLVEAGLVEVRHQGPSSLP
jgi:hypothetical protein